MKEHKTQILAALALAFVLGVVAPTAGVFASDGAEEAGIETLASDAEGGNAAGDGAGDSEKALDLDDSVAELYKRIQTRDSFKDYRAALQLIENTEAIQDSPLLKNTETWAKGEKYYYAGVGANGSELWGNGLGGDTKSAVQNLPVYKAIPILKQDRLYTTTSELGHESVVSIVDALETSYNTLYANEQAYAKAAFPTLQNIDGMDLQDLIDTVIGLAAYNKDVALNDAMTFLTNAIVTGEDGSKTVSVDALNTLYSEADLMVKYSAMANAAAAIDKTATAGLATYTLPNTANGDDKKDDDEKKPDAPATGIVNFLETGALDLSTVVLLVSITVASVAGLGLIAKLYLRHKF